MTTKIEEMLARELHEVAGGVTVPPMPELPSAEPRRHGVRLWQPLVAAAAVALVVGVVALVLGQDRGSEPEPTPSPTPSVTETKPDTAIPATAPTMPYILGRRLYVDGAQVPGEWWGLESRQGVWLAAQLDGSWWWGGPGIEGAMPIEAQIDQGPAISSNGRYIAFVDLSSGEARVTGFDTQPAGEGFGAAPIDGLPSSEDGVAIRVAAVTDEGDVIVQGTRTRLMWRAQFEDQQTVVDLSETAPDQVILEATPAGLVVVDGATGATDATSTEPYLATVSGDGTLDRLDTLPTYSDLAVSPGGTWLVRAPAGSLGGEVTVVTTLNAQEIGSNDEVVLQAPEGFGFAANTWAWEDEEYLIAALLPDRRREDPQLVRCSVTVGACQAFPGPAAG